LPAGRNTLRSPGAVISALTAAWPLSLVGRTLRGIENENAYFVTAYVEP
jgi:hypothetical protein